MTIQVGEPIDQLEELWNNILKAIHTFDFEIQDKISQEINKGKVQIKAQEYIRDKNIKRRTKFSVKTSSAEKVSSNIAKIDSKIEDLPEDREFIDFGHENFDVVFNIMLGIKRSIDCIFHSPFSLMRKSDYSAEYQYKNEWYSSSIGQTKTFVFVDIAPKVFEDIRYKDDISNDEYIQALGPNNIYNFIWTKDFKSFTQLVSSGKSGSLFYYTPWGKFMLKTIAKEEFDKLISTLPEYHQHLLANPDSLITRYYGLHRIQYKMKNRSKEQYIIIMNNMFRNFSPDIKYDLKGSTVGRSTTFKDGKVDSKIALKDNDFTDSNVDVCIDGETINQILDIIKKDSEYLGSNATLDYSLLLGIINLENNKQLSQTILGNRENQYIDYADEEEQKVQLVMKISFEVHEL